MKRQLSTILFLLFCKIVFGQTNLCIDLRYVEAIKYINQTDSVKSFIKKGLDKKALSYKVKDGLIKSQTEYFWRTLKTLNISRADLHKIDSLSNDKINITGLNLLSVDTTSIYRLEFSEIIDNKIYAHLTQHQRYREFDNGLIAVGGGRYLVFLFIFNDTGHIERVFYGTLDKE